MVDKLVEELLSIMCLGDIWHASKQPFGFCQEKDGWTWICYDTDLISEQQAKSLQRRGFETRKSAAQYIDNIFGLSLLKEGFSKSLNSSFESPTYIFPGYYIRLRKSKQNGWMVFNLRLGALPGSKKFFSTRREAIAFVVEEHPEYVKPMYNIPNPHKDLQLI